MAEPRFIHRTLRLDAPAYQQSLARTLVGILGRSVHDLPGIVDALNKAGSVDPNGATWTEQVFCRTMEEFGAYPNSVGASVGSHHLGAEPAGLSTDANISRANKNETVNVN